MGTDYSDLLRRQPATLPDHQMSIFRMGHDLQKHIERVNAMRRRALEDARIVEHLHRSLQERIFGKTIRPLGKREFEKLLRERP